MRKTCLYATLLCAMALGTTTAKADGVVTATARCGGDVYMVQAQDGFTLIEWYSGHPLAKGDTIIGDMDSLGMKNVTLSTGDKLQIFIDNYGLNQSTATQILNAKCGRPPLVFP